MVPGEEPVAGSAVARTVVAAACRVGARDWRASSVASTSGRVAAPVAPGRVVAGAVTATEPQSSRGGMASAQVVVGGVVDTPDGSTQSPGRSAVMMPRSWLVASFQVRRMAAVI